MKRSSLRTPSKPAPQRNVRTRPTARMPSLLPVGVLLVLVAAAPVQGAFNPTYDYEASYPFSGFGEGNITLVSGRATVDTASQEGRLALVGVEGFRLTGLDRVCWQQDSLQCVEGDLAITVSDGGAVGMHTDGGTTAGLQADHALMTFQDLSGARFEGFDLGPSLIATTIGGTATLTLPAVAKEMTLDPERAGVLPLDGETVMTLHRDQEEVARIQGDRQPFLYSGKPTIEPLRVEAVVYPFADGHAMVAPAEAGAAREGLDLDRVFSVLERLTGDEAATPIDLRSFSGTLSGAVLQVPSQQGGPEDMVLVRFERLTLAGGDAVHAQASASLVMESGQVRGAGPLVGVGYLALPMWSIVLWLVGVGVWTARVAAKAPKKVERWQRYWWVGLALTPVALLVVFLLWDREMHALLGVSVLHPGDVPLAYLLLAQLGFLSLILFAAAAPLRIILRNGAMLAKQGDLMGLAAPVATVAGFLIGVTLLPSYLEFMLQRVLGSMG